MISPHGTEHPHGTQNIPHIYHDIPHGTEHPPRYSRYPPTVLMISPHGTHESPTVLNTPTVLSTPHGTAHTLYRVTILNENHLLLDEADDRDGSGSVSEVGLSGILSNKFKQSKTIKIFFYFYRNSIVGTDFSLKIALVTNVKPPLIRKNIHPMLASSALF